MCARNEGRCVPVCLAGSLRPCVCICERVRVFTHVPVGACVPMYRPKLILPYSFSYPGNEKLRENSCPVATNSVFVGDV